MTRGLGQVKSHDLYNPRVTHGYFRAMVFLIRD